MTSLAFILGCVPLAISVGAGANSRHSLGTGIIGGMIGASTLALLFVPLFFLLFDKLSTRAAPTAATGSADDGQTPDRAASRDKDE
jgi:multidrug efflux pump